MADAMVAETSGGRLSFARGGAGEPLLLVMGVAGHHQMWGPAFTAALEASFDVVAFDHRGIGESSRIDTAVTITELADDAVALLDHLGWDSAHVLGISMGGTVAQELALRHPQRVRSLVLGCTWAGTSADRKGPWGPSVGKIAEAAGGGDPVAAARLMFEANFSPSFAREPGRFAEFVRLAGAVKVPGPVVLMQMQAAVGFEAAERLAALAVPTLVLHGTADEVILPAEGERLAALIPGAVLETFEGVGHLFFWEEPVRVAELVSSHALGRVRFERSELDA